MFDLSTEQWSGEQARPTEGSLLEFKKRLQEEATPLWQLDIAELTGHNIEPRGREEVNRLVLCNPGTSGKLQHNIHLFRLTRGGPPA